MLFIFMALTPIRCSCNIKYSLGGAVVQLGERLTGSQEVGSSSLLSSTILYLFVLALHSVFVLCDLFNPQNSQML